MTFPDLIDRALNLVLDRPPLVTVVRLAGVIGGGAPLRKGLSLAELAGPLKAAFAPQSLAAVALIVNSPGGSPVQSALIAKRIRAHAEEKKVPVLAFVEDVAASGGYWLAAAADEIIVDDSSILGSIGVVSAGFGLHEAIARLGIERRLYAQGERKRMLDPFLPVKPDDVERLSALQAEIHDGFKQYVRERRGARLAAPEDELFNGDIWTGRRAVELGLADAVGDLRGTLRERYGDKVRIRTIEAGGRRISRLLGLERRDFAADLLAAVEDRAVWGRYGL